MKSRIFQQNARRPALPRIAQTMAVGLLGFCVSASAANVDLSLFNSEPLLDSDSVTTLVGSSTTPGDLVQLILAGANGVPNLPTTTGGTTGDDVLLSVASNPTSVGTGYIPAGTGKLTQTGMIYSDTLVGDSVYVRFWNASTAGGATYYGNSAVYTLPAADGFGFANLDFAPLTTSPRTANQAQVQVPTLTEWGFIILVILLGWMGLRHIPAVEPDTVQ